MWSYLGRTKNKLVMQLLVSGLIIFTVLMLLQVRTVSRLQSHSITKYKERSVQVQARLFPRGFTNASELEYCNISATVVQKFCHYKRLAVVSPLLKLSSIVSYQLKQWCNYSSVYQLQDVTSQQLASGERFIVLTQHPFYQTEVEFRGDDYDQILWINPSADDFLIAKELKEWYQRNFQSKLGKQVLDSDHFMEYVQTNVKQLQIHSEYWRRYNNSQLGATELKVSKDGNMRVAINSTYDSFNSTNIYSCALEEFNTKTAYREYDPLIERVSDLVKLARLGMQSGSQQLNNVNILTTYFLSQNIDRQNELDYSLLHNVHLDRVKLHLWTDQKPTTKDALSKLQITQMDNLKILKARYQQNYFDYFQYANRFLKNEVVVIQNSDIVWPQESIEALLQQLRQAPVGTMYALSRHTMDIKFPLSVCKSALRGHNNNMCQQYFGSHDVIAFIPPVDPMMLRQLNFKQNTWGAENVVIELFRYYGWTVLNPCHQIKTIHIHCSNQRRATGARINPPATGQRTLRKNTVAYPTVLSIEGHKSNASL